MKTLQELLGQQWVKRDGTPDEKMVQHCIKSGLYVQVGDTFIHCGSKKPSIESQMWYDDETDGPDASKFAAFRNYNIRSSLQPMLENDSNKEIWITTHWHNDRTGGKMLSITTKRWGDLPRSGELRKATQQEIDLANEARKMTNADYEKRLLMYWKRYSDKVHASGYWANR
jgi:hypothetical protein